MAILDFTKAFDKVPHKRLIHKLNYYGITGSIATWIETFLTGRTQQVVVNGPTSSSTIVTSGVPQGTVLGPLLFLLYINDPPDNLSTSVRLFADDCILYTPIRTQNDPSLLIIIIIEAFIKRRIPGKTTCSKALQYRGSNKN